MTLAYIVFASLAGGLVSALLAALIAWRIQPRLIPLFVSYAVGALLGVVFLDVLPHIFEKGGQSHDMAAWILAGIFAFFVLEKLVLWRHNHDHAGQAEAAIAAHSQHHAGQPSGHAHGGAIEPGNAVHGHGHRHEQDHTGDTGRRSSAWMIIIGDGFHNFTDGFAIATAFMADVRLGIVTSIAIVAHELPQELGDFLVLIHSGFSKRRALFWNIVSSFATLAGAMIAYVALSSFEKYSLVFLCFAASSMIYVAIADLIPGLHRRTSLLESVQQIVLIAVGVASIQFFNLFLPH